MHRHDLWRFIALILTATLIGWLVGSIPWMLCAGVVGYAAWQHRTCPTCSAGSAIENNTTHLKCPGS